MKKVRVIPLLLLAALLSAALFALPASAGENVYFVKDGGEGDGTSDSGYTPTSGNYDPTTSNTARQKDTAFYQLVGKILASGNDGVIVVCGPVTFDASTGQGNTESVRDVMWDISDYDPDVTITYTSVYNGVDYRQSGARLTFASPGAHLLLPSSSVFENITIERTVVSGDNYICACGNPVLFGSGTVFAPSSLSLADVPSAYVGVCGGERYRRSASGSRVIIDVGNETRVGRVYGGKHSVAGENYAMGGDASIVIKSGLFVGDVGGGSVRSDALTGGHSSITVEGGVFRGSIYAVGNGGFLSDDRTARVRIEGGDFSGCAGIFASASGMSGRPAAYSLLDLSGASAGTVSAVTALSSGFSATRFPGSDDPPVYEVAYDANGGSGAPSPQAKDRHIPLTLSSVLPAKTGWFFTGWAFSPSASSPDLFPGGKYAEDTPVTLYAVWERCVFPVVYNANGGTGTPSVQAKRYGIDLRLSPALPSREGFDFLGWARDGGAATAEFAPGATYSANAPLSLYAVWRARSFTVTFDANGGRNAPSPRIKTAGEPLILPAVKPVREGYVFLGWATGPSADSAAFQPGGSYAADENAALYAVWKVFSTSAAVGLDIAGGGTAFGPGDAVTVDLKYSGLDFDVYGFAATLSWGDGLRAETLSFGSGLDGGTCKAPAAGGIDPSLSSLTIALSRSGNVFSGAEGTAASIVFRVSENAPAENQIALTIVSMGEDVYNDRAGSVSASGVGIFAAPVGIADGEHFSLLTSPSVSGKAVEGYAVRTDLSGVTVSRLAPALNAGGRALSVKANGVELPASSVVPTGALIEVSDGGTPVGSAVFVVRGDANGSGSVDVFDAVALLKWIVAPLDNALSAPRLVASDANVSGEANIFDAVAVLTRVVNGVW